MQEGVAILLGLLHATETGNKLQLCRPLAHVYLNLPILILFGEERHIGERSLGV